MVGHRPRDPPRQGVRMGHRCSGSRGKGRWRGEADACGGGLPNSVAPPPFLLPNSAPGADWIGDEGTGFTGLDKRKEATLKHFFCVSTWERLWSFYGVWERCVVIMTEMNLCLESNDQNNSDDVDQPERRQWREAGLTYIVIVDACMPVCILEREII
jgi:hypothetical protein